MILRAVTRNIATKEQQLREWVINEETPSTNSLKKSIIVSEPDDKR